MVELSKYDDDQPRANDGKWTGGGGGGSGGGSGDGGSGGSASDHERATASLQDSGFVQRHMDRLSSAGDAARASFPHEERAHDAAHAAAQTAIHAEAMAIHAQADRAKEKIAADRANEDSAIAAGHVTTEARDTVGAYVAGQKERQKQIDDDADALDGAHRAAATAIADLKQYEHDGDELHEPREIESLSESSDGFSETQDHLDNLSSGDAKRDTNYDSNRDRVAFPEAPEQVDDPGKLDDYEPGEIAPQEHADLVAQHAKYETEQAAYESKATEHEAEFKRRAATAQTALESLHEKQVAVLDRLKISQKEGGKAQAAAQKALDAMDDGHHVKEDAFAHHERDDGGDIIDEHAAEAYGNAHRADETMREHAQEQIDAHESGGAEDAIDSLKEEARSTAAAIKELVRHTKRPAKLAGKTKKANRPDGAAAASVSSMAPRYKLRLSKLDFVSPVDEPAQQTARVLLIKRSGPVKGFARVTKVDEGLGLVFCWAFTSKVAGADYHDLQGDAIDEDFIKAAADFMTSGGGATDEMHDGKASGRVVFAMPMTPDIAKAYGVVATTTGLMVALKPPADVLAKFKSGEYTGVSIAGTGIREIIGKRRALRKASVLTSVVDGHQHNIDLDDPADGWSDSLSTSYQTATDATDGHSHAWTFDAATGAITIAMDSGHTHTADAVVPADVIARAAERDCKRCPNCSGACDDDDRYCPGCGARMDGGAPAAPAQSPPAAPAVVVVAARNSPLSVAGATVKSEPKEHAPMANENDKIAEIEKRAARFEKMSTLTDAARAHFQKLSGGDAEAFLCKSVHERDAVLSEIEKANEVVHTSPVTGRVFRKSDSTDLITMAKQLDELTVSKQKAETEARDATFAKRGDEVLKNFPKGAKGNLRGRIMKALNAEFTDPAEYEEAVQAAKGMDAAFGSLGVPRGFDGGGDAPGASGAQKRLDAKVAEFAKAHSLSIPLAYARATASDPEIRALYNEVQSGN